MYRYTLYCILLLCILLLLLYLYKNIYIVYSQDDIVVQRAATFVIGKLSCSSTLLQVRVVHFNSSCLRDPHRILIYINIE